MEDISIDIGGKNMSLKETDAEFMERFEHFAFDEVVHEKGQEPYIRQPIILDLDACFHFLRLPIRFLKRKTFRCLWKIRQQQRWKTVWKKELLLRQKSLESI